VVEEDEEERKKNFLSKDFESPSGKFFVQFSESNTVIVESYLLLYINFKKIDQYFKVHE